MKKIIFIILSLVFPAVPLISYGQSLNEPYFSSEYTQYLRSDYLVSANNVNALNDFPENVELEHPFRRFEITFFISAPFTFIISYLTLNIYDVITESIEKKRYDGNVNVWKEYKMPLLAGTFGLSSAIAIREAWICMKMNKIKKGEKTESSGGRTIFLYVAKSF